MKFIAELPEGAVWAVFDGKIIVAGRDFPPYYQNEDGTKTPVLHKWEVWLAPILWSQVVVLHHDRVSRRKPTEDDQALHRAISKQLD